ncbi:GNAT family N-acetyltransferase [Tepidimicrobium xylanilyticum]|uniref:GNAT family N-acetyltransferase n=1 Tax=Tepidimicrobium xylanilyticum TaxID=1123352 RepID=UPI000B870B87|nr:GNAT family N-acetyltransferase [Tepidimicrobium xylanilyticum]GMG95726.1 hypothetical protein EN5CB1_05520 [Tepidimicrobium xylanilyticum]
MLYFLINVPHDTVRFKFGEKSLYFFRLSVCPEARRRGIAKSILSWLENYAKEHRITEIWYRVQMSIPQNIQLYQSVGYTVYKEKNRYTF